jgi:hypothetical protein
MWRKGMERERNMGFDDVHGGWYGPRGSGAQGSSDVFGPGFGRAQGRAAFASHRFGPPSAMLVSQGEGGYFGLGLAVAFGGGMVLSIMGAKDDGNGFGWEWGGGKDERRRAFQEHFKKQRYKGYDVSQEEEFARSQGFLPPDDGRGGAEEGGMIIHAD